MHLLPLLLVLLGQAPANDPFTGTWVANIAKSRLARPLEGATVRIAVSGDTVTMSASYVMAGKELKAAETFRSDGKETPGTLTPGTMLASKFVGTHVLASIATKGGNVIVLQTWEVSADGKTLTSRSSGTVEQVIVYERQ